MTAVNAATARASGRVLFMWSGVGVLAAVTFALLLTLVRAGAVRPLDALVTGSWGAAASLLALTVLLVAMLPSIARAARGIATGAAVSRTDRDAIYASPRRAAFAVSVLAVGSVVAGGQLPPGGAIAANVGAGVAVLFAGVLYAATRFALRPLVERLPPDEAQDADRASYPIARTDRLDARVSLAVAAPAGTAALLAALVVSLHVVSVSSDQAIAERETFDQALRTDTVRGERARSIEVAASAFRAAGVLVAQHGEHYEVARAPTVPMIPPWWTLPVSLLAAMVMVPIARRIGLNASLDLQGAARRMSGVGVAEIRSVTMGMARPDSVPEVREMALAMDILAAALLRMSEDQKRAVTVRTEAARVRSFMLASVSHDLRGPLNSVLGFGDLLLSGAEGPLTDSQRESLEALCRGGRDLLRLVADLLDHAQLDADRMVLDRSRVAMDSLVEGARALALERVKQPIVGMVVTIEGEQRLDVIADRDRLERALGALIAFAVLRPGSDGRVTVQTRREAIRCTVHIRGSGTTPSQEALQRLFEPFDHAPSGARAPAGLNLAVSVARGIVRLHSGTVVAQPSAEGGIVLTVQLPRAD